MMMAPMAPMAPPSVGVAMPRKMVPSTRKISSSGGISTKVTARPLRQQAQRVMRLMDAATKARATPKHMAQTMVSSVATLSTVSPVNQVWMASMWWAANRDTPTHSTVRASSEGRPLEPFSSDARFRRQGRHHGGLEDGQCKISSMYSRSA
jgi:hypothetical protein